jgi:transcription elongation factor GreA
VSASPVVTDDGVLVTADGYARLQAALEALRTVRRPELGEQLRVLREAADADDPAFFDLLEEQAQLEGRIGLLEAQIAAARVVGPARDGAAGIGTSVRVRHADTGESAEYRLVGPIEADADGGRVSVASPVGRALVGARPGETVVVEAPRGPAELEILAVRPA